MVAQADGIPIHTGGGGFALRAVLRDFAGRVEEEDVFLLSDPYTEEDEAAIARLGI